MFQPPDHYHGLSMRLSEVLSDIGVNKRMVTMRRKMFKLLETIGNIDNQISDSLVSTFYFGSQTEGSTTVGLKSDIDTLLVFNLLRANQDWSECEPGQLQWLMIQNDRTSPGYCLLQLVMPDEPLSIQDIQDAYHTIDVDGNALLTHSPFTELVNSREVRHGPARTTQGGPHGLDRDLVAAFPCSSWPKEGLPWLQQQYVSGWPTAEMKKYSERQGCFVVPVASKTTFYPELEWRISTSHAERCLMLNLNITQMRCYILMKMMLKTYIDPKCKDVVSSFMCKNVLFRCIADSPAAAWREPLIIQCLIQCLEALLNCVLTGNCPHFIIPGNNLLAGKLTVAVKQQIVVIMCELIQNIERSLLNTRIDDIGERLCVKSGGLQNKIIESAFQAAFHLSIFLVVNSARYLQFSHSAFLHKLTNIGVDSTCDFLTRSISKLLEIYKHAGKMEKLACHLYVPFLCTQLGSVMASVDIQHSQEVSYPTLKWFQLGLKSDATSSSIKLASALYCSGDIIGSEIVLEAVKRRVQQTPSFSFCNCSVHETWSPLEVQRTFYEKHEQSIKENFMLCVRFLPSEVHCVPVELRYEMFRSTQNDLPYRDKYDFWMDWAVVDSLPFLYFLQYKVYSQLQRPADQYTALGNLVQTIDTEPNLGHRETAFNLLGQCMEQENRWQDAARYYKLSLNVRLRNNAAKWHICRMFAGLLSRSQNK